MKNESDNEELLNDVFADAAPPAFRAALLDQTLHAVQRRKQVRRRNQALTAAASVVAALALVARFASLRTSPPPAPVDAFIIRSQPLSAPTLVATQVGTVDTIHSSGFAVTVVRTSSMPQAFEEIGEKQLLDLFAGRPLALVHRGPSQTELVFVNPPDQNGFPVQ